jgi:hypothetical protein
MRAAGSFLAFASGILAVFILALVGAIEFLGSQHIAGAFVISGIVALIIGPSVAENLRKSYRKFSNDENDRESWFSTKEQKMIENQEKARIPSRNSCEYLD